MKSPSLDIREIAHKAGRFKNYIEMSKWAFPIRASNGIFTTLKNPYSVLETLLARSQYCVLSTRVARFTPSKAIDLDNAPVAYLVDESETNNDATNYWIFTNSGLKRLLTRSGWRIADYTSVGNTIASDPISAEGDERAYCFAEMTGVPITTGRLVSGWHDQKHLEDWRWTERRFTVAFPDVAPGSDIVSLQFFLPPAIADAFGALELDLTVNGHDLPTRTFTKSAHVYEEQIPRQALTSPVVAEFSLSKALQPNKDDLRELGIVVSKVSLRRGAHVA